MGDFSKYSKRYLVDMTRDCLLSSTEGLLSPRKPRVQTIQVNIEN